MVPYVSGSAADLQVARDRKESISSDWEKRVSSEKEKEKVKAKAQEGKETAAGKGSRAAAVSAAVDQYRKQSSRKGSLRARKVSRAATLKKLRSQSRLNLDA